MSAEREFLASVASYRDGRGYAIPAEFVLASAVRLA